MVLNMRILISNDDGVNAPGLKALADALSALADITVIAPDRDRSAASNSLTLDSPLRVVKHSNGFYGVTGTPTDCVHLAITGWSKEPHDMVVSGINFGANLGDDVLYSGTVAAAIEGRHLGYPAIAVSLVTRKDSGRHYDTAASVVRYIVRNVMQGSIPNNTILNINVPDVPIDQIKGIKMCRLGNRHKAEPIIPAYDPRGHEIFWVGPAGAEGDAGPGTDFDAVANGYVSITPIKTDMTDNQLLQDLSEWSDTLAKSPEYIEILSS